MDEKTVDDDAFVLRGYQQEMLELSLQRNIVCAMDTGSGKTAVAISRAQLALESCPPEKLVWFIAPTVVLCRQQSREFERRLPAYGVRTLCGADYREGWRGQADWDAALRGIRIVVSTPQVLLDALSSAFVKLTGIALLVLDEAHHATKRHAANIIMQHFYNDLLQQGLLKELPAILGLSASPVIKSLQSAKSGLEYVYE